MSSSRKIVIIEDDPDVLRIYTDVLTEKGYEIASISNSSEALSLLKQPPPRLILLDIMIPGSVNGIELLGQIKKDPNLKKIPIIVLTNLDTEEKIARELGANEYLVKPMTTVDQATAVIEKYI